MDPHEYEFVAADAHQIAPGMDGTYSGVDGYIHAMATFLEPWTGLAVSLRELFFFEARTLAALLRFTGIGVGSGMPIDERALTALQFDQGTIVRQTYWWDAITGLDSLGLRASPQRR
jgi:hypothetical protein